MEAYNKGRVNPRPERRGGARRRVIDAAKEAVTVVELAERLCGPGKLRKVGERWVACCPLPDHEDRTPSFTIYGGDRGWWCYGCLRGGDVIELARYAWGYQKQEVAMAAAELLHRFGHPIPERPESWRAKQERQQPIRSGIEAALILTARRRLYKRYFEPIIAATSDPEDRTHDEQALWEATLPLAEHLVGAIMRRAR